MNILQQQLCFGLLKVKSEYTFFAPILSNAIHLCCVGEYSDCAFVLTKYKLALGQEAESASDWQKVSNPSASEGI